MLFWPDSCIPASITGSRHPAGLFTPNGTTHDSSLRQKALRNGVETELSKSQKVTDELSLARPTSKQNGRRIVCRNMYTSIELPELNSGDFSSLSWTTRLRCLKSLASLFYAEDIDIGGYDALQLPPLGTVHYWRGIKESLEQAGCHRVVITRVPRTASIIERAEILRQQISTKCEAGEPLNLLGHSMVDIPKSA